MHPKAKHLVPVANEAGQHYVRQDQDLFTHVDLGTHHKGQSR